MDDQAGGETSISIRRAVAADAQAIGAVFDAAVRERWTYLGEVVRQPMFPPEEWDREVVAHAPPNVLLVAEHESHVVGFTAVHLAESEMYLLFVRPDWAGCGVGRVLLEAAHSALRAAGCSQSRLYTDERNTRAIAFYEAAGYRRDGSVRESDFRGLHLHEPGFIKAL